MEIKKTAKKEECEIALKGKFTFSDNQQFRSILFTLTSGTYKKVVINLADVEFIDSAGLGMLLLAKDEAEKHDIELVLRYPYGQPKKMLEISKFDELFKIY